MTTTAATVAAGPCRFTIDHDWARLPADCRWGITHAVKVDRDGFVHVLHTTDASAGNRDCCYVFDGDGGFVRSWGPQFQGSAHGLQLVEEDGEQVAYVTDLKRGLFKCRLDGEVLWQRDMPDFYRRRRLNWSPSNVAVASDGRVYLADGYGSYFIVVYSPQGEELAIIGGPGTDERHLIHPHGLSIDRRHGEERLVVCDNLITRLHYLSLDGQHIATSAEGDLVHPRHIAWHGDLMAVPDLVGRVSLFDRDDRCLGHLGASSHGFDRLLELRVQDPATYTPGEFVTPHDAAFDAHGNLYVSEWVERGRVSKLTRLD